MSACCSCSSYNRRTGIFTRRIATGGGRWKAGSVVGCLADGYILVSVDGVLYKAHRLAWFYVHGVWPDGDLDHKDTIRHHNWISNLRPATRAENMQNVRVARVDNRSGLLGAHWSNRDQKWFSRIKVGKKTHWLGYHPTAKAAHAAYKAAKRRLHPRSTM